MWNNSTLCSSEKMLRIEKEQEEDGDGDGDEDEKEQFVQNKSVPLNNYKLQLKSEFEKSI